MADTPLAPLLRRTCDRCYGKKLGCQGAIPGATCQRCTTAGESCVWSPSKRQKKRARAENENEKEKENGNLDKDGIGRNISSQPDDWTAFLNSQGFELDYGLGDGMFDGSHSLGLGASDDAGGDWINVNMGTADVPPLEGEKEVSSLRRLSNLNLDIQIHALEISRKIALREENRDEVEGKNGKDMLIDETFSLSQRLIHVLNDSYPLFAKTPMEKSQTAHPETRRSKKLPDSSSVILQQTCYFRLLKIYYGIFEQIRACVLVSDSIPESQYVRGPDIRIGSFSTQSSSSLHIMVILQVSAQLLERMQQLFAVVKVDASMDENDILGGLNTSIAAMTEEVKTWYGKTMHKREEVIEELLKSRVL